MTDQQLPPAVIIGRQLGGHAAKVTSSLPLELAVKVWGYLLGVCLVELHSHMGLERVQTITATSLATLERTRNRDLN